MALLFTVVTVFPEATIISPPAAVPAALVWPAFKIIAFVPLLVVDTFPEIEILPLRVATFTAPVAAIPEISSAFLSTIVTAPALLTCKLEMSFA